MMRSGNFIFVLFLSLLFACSDGKTHFEGKIVGYNGEICGFFFMNPGGDPFEIQFPVNEDGTFDAELDFAQSEYDARLFIDKFMFCTSIEKGTKHVAEFDIREEGVETNFKFTGNMAEENAFTCDFWNNFGFPYSFFEKANNVGSFETYSGYIKGLADGYRKTMSATGNKPFINFYEAKLVERELIYNYLYPYLYLRDNGVVPTDAAYDQFIAENKLAEYSDEEFTAIMSMLISCVATMDVDMLQMMKIAEKTTANVDWNSYLMTSLLMNRLKLMGPNGLDEAYKYYRSVVTNENYYNQIAADYEAASKLAIGAPAPEIEFVDANGKKFSLADLKGRALYIDFWASWCGPCREEIPHLAKLVEEVGNNDPDILCVSISIDDSEVPWKKLIEKDKPAWPQYLATEAGQKSISEDYQISGIPRFILIDKSGKIITVNAPRPSQLDKASLKALLK